MARVPNRDAIEVMLARELGHSFQRWCHWRGTGGAVNTGTIVPERTEEFLERGAAEGLWTLPALAEPRLTALGTHYFTWIEVGERRLGLARQPRRRFRVVDVTDTEDPDLKNFEFRYRIVDAPGVVSRWCQTSDLVAWGAIRRRGLRWRLD